MRKLLIILGALLVITIVLLRPWKTPNQRSSSTGLSQYTSADSGDFTRADGYLNLEFPRDHGPHPDYQTEWWYYTGNLVTIQGQRFGYQLTFFRRALVPEPQYTPEASEWITNQVYMAHFAVTDVSRNEHIEFERFSRSAVDLAGAQSEPFSAWLHDWRVEEVGPNTYQLHASAPTKEGEEVGVNLYLVDHKGPILQGDQGYSQKGPEIGQASYYYSLTRLETRGWITRAGQVIALQGNSWMDHEFSTSVLSEDQIGWDWFSIQLDDQRELMLFQIRQANGSIDPFSSGTIILSDGESQLLKHADFYIEVTDYWKSPTTGAQYPSGWKLTVPSENLALQIEPMISDQEMNLSYTYWEGAVQVSGSWDSAKVSGYGYVELTGYSNSIGGEF